MSKIRINDIIEIEGAVSARQEVQSTATGKVLVMHGILQCADYCPQITKISCERFALSGISVTSESFGSDDDFVVYEFTFNKIEVKKK